MTASPDVFPKLRFVPDSVYVINMRHRDALIRGFFFHGFFLFFNGLFGYSRI